MDEEQKEIIMKYYNLWEDFKHKIVFENRYFLSHEVLDLLLEWAIKNKKELESGTTFYRARLYSDDDVLDIDKLKKEAVELESEVEVEGEPVKEQLFKAIIKGTHVNKVKKYESNFWGYPKGKNLMPPVEVDVENGRANPQYIRYLYLADSPYTALAEVRPKISEKISIAEIVCTENMKIADLSYSAFIHETEINFLLYLIVEEFSAINNGSIKQYIPTQYIIEFLKHNGFDGAKYNSSLHKAGRNFVFFDDKKFEDLNSKVYELNNIKLYAKCANSSEEHGLQPIEFPVGVLPLKKE